MKKITATGIMLILIVATLTAQSPGWLDKRPISDEYFYGRGEGLSTEEAEQSGKNEILLQLNSQIVAMIRQESSSAGSKQQAIEKIGTFIDSARLRTAEVEERFQSGNNHYALVRYPENCGLIMTRGAIKRYEKEHSINPDTVIDRLDEGIMVRSARLERVFNDAMSEDYGGDISVSMNAGSLVIQVLNFAAFETELSNRQQQRLDKLSRSLLDELENLNYGKVTVEGHANPTGAAGEGDNLLRISRGRAETMAGFLRRANIPISSVQGIGDRRLLGDTKTEAGKGLNRRVEITVEVLQ